MKLYRFMSTEELSAVKSGKTIVGKDHSKNYKSTSNGVCFMSEQVLCNTSTCELLDRVTEDNLREFRKIEKKDLYFPVKDALCRAILKAAKTMGGTAFMFPISPARAYRWILDGIVSDEWVVEFDIPDHIKPELNFGMYYDAILTEYTLPSYCLGDGIKILGCYRVNDFVK